MRTTDLVKYLSEKTGLSQLRVSDLLAEWRKFMTEQLLAGKIVTIPKFGSFRKIERKAQNRYDMKAGEVRLYPAKQLIAFKVSEAFKEKLNPSQTEQCACEGSRESVDQADHVDF